MKCIYNANVECDRGQECFKVIEADTSRQLMKNVNEALYKPHDASKGIEKHAKYELEGVMIKHAGNSFFYQPLRCVRATVVRG